MNRVESMAAGGAGLHDPAEAVRRALSQCRAHAHECEPATRKGRSATSSRATDRAGDNRDAAPLLKTHELQPGTRYRSCSWCEELNPATETFCASCGHMAHVARVDCACTPCLRDRMLALEIAAQQRRAAR